MVPIHFAAFFTGDVTFRESSGADTKAAELFDEFNELIGVLEAALNFLKDTVCATFRITAQGENVFYPETFRFGQDIAQLVGSGVNTGQMRHRGERVLTLDTVDDHQRFFAGAAARSVCDRAI